MPANATRPGACVTPVTGPARGPVARSRCLRPVASRPVHRPGRRMTHIFQRIRRRTLLPALALGLALGASGLATAAAHAEPSGGSGTTTDTAKVKCTYANLDYSVGAKIPIYGSGGKVVSYQV